MDDLLGEKLLRLGVYTVRTAGYQSHTRWQGTTERSHIVQDDGKDIHVSKPIHRSWWWSASDYGDVHDIRVQYSAIGQQIPIT